MQSGRDTTLIGSNIVDDNGTTLIAQGNLNLLAGTNTSSQSDYKHEEKSGFFSSGGFGITIGSQEQSQDQKTTSTSSAAATDGSIKGNVNLSAGKTYQQTGSDVLTPKGDINISAQQVNILAARETQHSMVDTEFHPGLAGA